jgi:Tol biopolymer transport system component
VPVIRKSLPLVALLAALIAASMPLPSAGAALSANGLLAFRSDRSGQGEIYTMDAAGGSPTNLTRSTRVQDLDPAWSPDGSMIAFARRNRQTRKPDLFLMNANGRGRIRLTTTQVAERSPTWSPDGRLIAFSSRTGPSGPSRIFVMTAAGVGRRALTRQPAGTYDANPAWSPDGAKILFDSNRDGGFPELYVMNADGTRQIRLTFNGYVDANAAWSPDGTKIAFVRCCPDGTNEIYVMNADGTAELNLTQTATVEEAQPVWSPDGTMIAYAGLPAGGGNIDVYVMNADGTGQIRLTNDPSPDLAPTWQPLPA